MTTTGETDLTRLLRGLRPELRDGVYVFATLPPGQPLPPGLAPLMVFGEDEGTTLILPEAEARAAGLVAGFPCRWIVLTVHSSLAAVGLTAAVATRLAGHGIPANVVAAFQHDHVFVPADRAEAALAALEALAAES